MILMRQVLCIARRSICAAVASLVCLAICGSASATPYDQGAAKFIYLMEKQAAGTLPAAVGVSVARGLSVMNPAVALGTTALSLYMLACDTQWTSPGQCLSAGGAKIGLKPANAPEDRPSQAYSAPPTDQDLGAPAIQHGTGYWKEALLSQCSSVSGSPSSAAKAACVAAYQAAYPPPSAYADGGNGSYVDRGAGMGSGLNWTLLYGNPTAVNPAAGQLAAYCDNNGAGWVFDAGSNDPPACKTSSNACPTGSTLQGDGHCHRVSCPAGTSLNGSLCVGTIITPDGVNRFKSNSGTWGAANPGVDIDNTPAPVYSPSSPITYNGIDAFGNLQRISARPRADGGIDVEIATNYVDGGSTKTQYNSATIDAAGNVNEKVNTQAGPMAASPFTQTGTSDTTGTQQVVIAPGSIQLPTDYNREPTQQSVLSTLQNGVKIKEDGTPTGGDFSGADTAADTAKAAAETLATNATKAEGKDTSWGFALTLPSVCTNPAGIVVPNWHINWVPDLCQFSDRIQAVTGFLWILLTLGSCLAMVRQTVSGGG